MKEQEINDYLVVTSDFTSSVNKYSMRFINPKYEEEFIKYKYEKKNLLVGIGIDILFNMIIIGARLVLAYFKGWDDLKSSQIVSAYTIV